MGITLLITPETLYKELEHIPANINKHIFVFSLLRLYLRSCHLMMTYLTSRLLTKVAFLTLQNCKASFCILMVQWHVPESLLCMLDQTVPIRPAARCYQCAPLYLGAWYGFAPCPSLSDDAVTVTRQIIIKIIIIKN